MARPPARLDIYRAFGSTVTDRYVLEDENGPVDLTGTSIVKTVKTDAGATALTLNATLGPGDGEFFFPYSTANATAVAHGKHPYSVWITYVDSTTEPLYAGQYCVEQL